MCTSKYPKRVAGGGGRETCVCLVPKNLRARWWDAGMADKLLGRFGKAGEALGSRAVTANCRLPSYAQRPGTHPDNLI